MTAIPAKSCADLSQFSTHDLANLAVPFEWFSARNRISAKVRHRTYTPAPYWLKIFTAFGLPPNLRPAEVFPHGQPDHPVAGSASASGRDAMPTILVEPHAGGWVLSRGRADDPKPVYPAGCKGSA